MKNRVRPALLFSIFIILALALTGCEKDRPAPKPATNGTGTPATGTRVAGTAAPGAAKGTTTAGSAATPGTPVPPTPIPLQSTQATAAPAGTAQAGTAAGTQTWTYTVQAGDTLSQITGKLNVSRDAILALNPGLNPDVLAAGQQIKIPGELPPEYGGYGSYTVQSGDTLASLAGRFGMTVQELQTANNIADPTSIQPGQTLKVKGVIAAAQPAATPAPTTAAGTAAGGAQQTTTYIVQRGDILSRIAARYGVTVQYLVRLNGLANADAIYTGQRLLVPATGTQGATGGTQTGGQQYTVQRGDTLTSIAARFGVTRQALMNANGISNPDLIRVGQVLQIP